ncbi:hypothetical protein ACFU5Y_20330 [Streptomyces gardneri]|uniref:hypothetical protein n=1 Tax=Streptomyces gardneri TaxID=66892 RepID=UPI0036AC80BD
MTRSGHLRGRPGDFWDITKLRGSGILAAQSGIRADRQGSHAGLLMGTPNFPQDAAGWRPDGLLHYLGASTVFDRPVQRRDALSHPTNARLLAAAEEGRPIHVFETGRRTARYIDEFILEDVGPPQLIRAGNGFVYPPVFKLRPTETVAHVPGQLAAVCDSQVVTFRAVERGDLLCNQGALDTAKLRPENKLVLKFCQHLNRSGHSTLSLQIRHTPDHAPMFTDIWVDSAYLLIEAKVKPDRESVRMALSQLADYTRFLEQPKRAVLLSGRPEPDVITLAHSQQSAVIWPTKGGNWVSSIGWLTHLGISQAPE